MSYQDIKDRAWATWASVPWTPVRDSDTTTSGGNIIGWQKQRVPYVPGDQCLSLQTLDVWIPANGSGGASQTPPQPIELPKVHRGHWLIFIHGGAWRDPEIDSSCFSATALNILRKVASGSGGSVPLEGLASINYRLSPYPDHPTDPSPPRDPGATPDPARQAKHPEHLKDVLTGIGFLQTLAVACGPYVLAGHSCGATLAFQAAMDVLRWELKHPRPIIVTPVILLGVNGLYDLAGFIERPPRKYEHLRVAYEEFTRAAFGDDPSVWKAACPATAGPGPRGWSWLKEWAGGKRIFLVDSSEDTLVPYDQLEALRRYVTDNSSFPIELRGADGGHDDIWVKGDRLAEVCLEAISRLGEPYPSIAYA